MRSVHPCAEVRRESCVCDPLASSPAVVGLSLNGGPFFRRNTVLFSSSRGAVRCTFRFPDSSCCHTLLILLCPYHTYLRGGGAAELPFLFCRARPRASHLLASVVAPFMVILFAPRKIQTNFYRYDSCPALRCSGGEY